MINWLRKKSKFVIQSNFLNSLHYPMKFKMFVTEQTLLNTKDNQPLYLKLLVYNENGDEYELNVPQEMIIEKIMMMSVVHFYGPLEAVGDDVASGTEAIYKDKFKLVLVRSMKVLDIDSSVIVGELITGDELFLLKCQKDDKSFHMSKQFEQVNITMDMINKETCNIIAMNMDREANPINIKLDFKIAFRQILMTMIEISVRLIAIEENADELFDLVFLHLEKRYKPKVDNSSLKQLTEMGFTEEKAMRALKTKKDLVEAMDLLLDESPVMPSLMQDGSLPLTDEKRFTSCDPVEKVMQEFNKYIEKWFVPEAGALLNLTKMGYEEALAKEALRNACNNESIAQEFLDGKCDVEVFRKGFYRNSPIMSAILEPSIVQVALSKPRTLLALMILYETPNNINIWMSDPGMHPVVSQILRTYYAEKHRLSHELTYESSLSDDTADPMIVDDTVVDPVTTSFSLLGINDSIPVINSMPKFTNLHRWN